MHSLLPLSVLLSSTQKCASTLASLDRPFFSQVSQYTLSSPVYTAPTSSYMPLAHSIQVGPPSPGIWNLLAPRFLSTGKNAAQYKLYTSIPSLRDYEDLGTGTDRTCVRSVQYYQSTLSLPVAKVTNHHTIRVPGFYQLRCVTKACIYLMKIGLFHNHKVYLPLLTCCLSVGLPACLITRFPAPSSKKAAESETSQSTTQS